MVAYWRRLCKTGCRWERWRMTWCCWPRAFHNNNNNIIIVVRSLTTIIILYCYYHRVLLLLLTNKTIAVDSSRSVAQIIILLFPRQIVIFGGVLRDSHFKRPAFYASVLPQMSLDISTEGCRSVVCNDNIILILSILSWCMQVWGIYQSPRSSTPILPRLCFRFQLCFRLFV